MSRRPTLALLGVTVFATLALATWILAPLDPRLLTRDARPGFSLLDRHGLELRSLRAGDGSRRRWVPLAETDPDLLAAFLATEDRRFYGHAGVDPRSVVRAVRANLAAGRTVSGASTITMQLARMLRPADRSWTAKLGQALWALRLERQLDKPTILEQYLNRVPLGQGAVGVDAAAELYFGASARDLSLGQAALLAGIARAPSSSNPLVSPARAALRRRFALGRLVASGYASRASADRARREPLIALEPRERFLAPHFTTRVAVELERDGVPAGGIRRTSLDLGLQWELEAEARHAAETLSERGARHAALIALDNTTGEILAWVGSPDFWADTAGQVDMVASPRQPGSALKPFLYALAFDRGYTPASILADVPRVWQTSTGPYAPRNYDRDFHGPVRAREALASSYNVPAVGLAAELGVGSLLQILRAAGFTSLGRDAEFYGLGLALGNGDVTLLELANGYRALAAGGLWRPYRTSAAAPGEAAPPGRRVASALAAALVLDVLDDPVARIPGFGLDTPFDFPFPVAAKTGTSRHFTDNWAVGVTGRFTVAVWVGNFSGRPMDGVSGVSGAGPLLHRAVLAVARRYPPGLLPTPALAGAVPVAICRLSGLRATDRCPGMTEWFVPGTEPDRARDWLRAGRSPGGGVTPARPDSAFRESVTGGFRIVSPEGGDVYRVPPGVDRRYATIALRAAGHADGVVRWFVDGRAVAGTRWQLVPGDHLVRAEAGPGAFDSQHFKVE